ncbi:DUF2812 domain-containing protein [Oceanobacillus chungangensis]|uniref:DUF2812 domain-containing protein n=1 Tax=Oceanobacillus chungangensis TaxID=1229152 RepID=A0A3D8PHM1_9BACI|nr:DUF2812 domain-containing protein [Oceanobacillus chungangensis]RDW14987.1 hypothetical protein CWR45_19200 [Oceanobacillus chungangensis]
MMKRIFQPFWSYDVEKTEEWLHYMALQGYHFVKVNLITRQFYFVERRPQAITYRIEIDKGFYSLPSVLVNEGWEVVFNDRNWYVIANNRPDEEIMTHPIREGIFMRNGQLLQVYKIILMTLILLSLFPLSITLLIMLDGDATITIVKSPMWVLTFLYWLIILGLPINSILKLSKVNRRLEEDYYPIKDRTTVKLDTVKYKLGWIYAPDKLENWLESLEMQGFNLERVNKWGFKFYFTKGEPRKVRYCADYQNNVTRDYFEAHKESGWQLQYSNKMALSKWSIWSKQYEEREERPELYSDSEQMKKHAKRVLATHLAICLPMIIMFMSLLVMNIGQLMNESSLEINFWTMIILQLLIIIQNGIFAIRVSLYYQRVNRMYI